MRKATRSAEKPSAEQTVLRALKAKPRISAAEVCERCRCGPLARWQDARPAGGLAGEVRRIEGDREGRRRLPDRWMLFGTKPKDEGTRGKVAKRSVDGERLRPGQLDGLVLAYLKKNARSTPHGPGTVARALNRSSGAVANCLVRLARAERVRGVSERPRRYSLAA